MTAVENMARELSELDDPRIPALAALAVIDERWREYEAINRSIEALQEDFPSLVQMIDTKIYRAVVTALDAVLGDEIASYFLDEARNMRNGGRIVEANGTEWPIKTIDDVRAYAMRVCR